MARTEVNSRQIKNGSVWKEDMNTTTVGQAVIQQLKAGANVSIEYTGVDEGTGIVTLSADRGSVLFSIKVVGDSDTINIPMNNQMIVMGELEIKQGGELCISGELAMANG